MIYTYDLSLTSALQVHPYAVTIYEGSFFCKIFLFVYWPYISYFKTFSQGLNAIGKVFQNTNVQLTGSVTLG